VSKPPTIVELTWQGDLRFHAVSDRQELTIDSGGNAGPSPMQLTAFGLAGCMSIDVISILQKGRHPVSGLRVSLSGERLPELGRHCVLLRGG